MASVTIIVTSGDNDPPIEPVRYHMHYMYCDACYSFDLENWTEPPNHDVLTKRLGKLRRILVVVGVLMLMTIGLAILNQWIPFITALVLFVGLLIYAQVLKARIRLVGCRCRNCRTTYAFGGSMYTNLEYNPAGFDFEDVPRPLTGVMKKKGSIL